VGITGRGCRQGGGWWCNNILDETMALSYYSRLSEFFILKKKLYPFFPSLSPIIELN
jgi:hypothetical protein